jgi:gluconolactonase
MTLKQLIPGIILLAAVYSCQPAKEVKTIGSIDRLDPALDNILSPDAKVEIIADGFDWTEGPLWLDDKKMLLFSDIPRNSIYKWTEEKGAELYLKPAGFTGDSTASQEPGSNGLLLDDEGNLLLCQHGDRRLAMMLAPLDSPKAEFQTIVDKYDGKRLNSPNDAVFNNYDFYFTDPPYGFKGIENPPKEIPFQGVYRVSADGGMTLLVDSVTRPNGIAFTRDGNRLFIACSDPAKAVWYRYDVIRNDDGVSLGNGKVFYDATSLTASEKGLPDGMKIDSNGTIFATGPGGVFIFNQDGKVLGKIKLPDAPTSNTALSADEKTLFITNDMNILRVTLRK